MKQDASMRVCSRPLALFFICIRYAVGDSRRQVQHAYPSCMRDCHKQTLFSPCSVPTPFLASPDRAQCSGGAGLHKVWQQAHRHRSPSTRSSSSRHAGSPMRDSNTSSPADVRACC